MPKMQGAIFGRNDTIFVILSEVERSLFKSDCRGF